MVKRISVSSENETGRNIKFHDNYTGNDMTRAQFVKEINNGTYGDKYYVRKQNGVDTPVSKPDDTKNNNLG